MNIIVLGYRGTGKSVISRLLAKQLKRPLFSLDSMIEEAVGIPIPEIVSLWGWARFREIESKIVEQAVGEAKEAVIDCGGGVVLNSTDNRSYVASNNKNRRRRRFVPGRGCPRNCLGGSGNSRVGCEVIAHGRLRHHR